MSDQDQAAPLFPNPGLDAFAFVMDTVAPGEFGAEAGEGAETAAPAGPTPAGAAAAGAATAPTAGSDPGGGDPGADGTPVAGDEPGADAGSGAEGGADGADGADGAAGAGAGDRPAAWTASAAEIAPQLSQLSTALEERTFQAYQAKALEEVQVEYAKYFEALEKHPRLLVGVTVPGLTENEETVVLRDPADAKDWQDAVKSILVAEVRARATKTQEENSDFLATVHASIDMFRNNSDLVPGTKDFDTELANRFTSFVKPYELRVEGKLQGYSIPVQPIIDRLREQIAAERQAGAARAAAAPPAASVAAASAAPPASTTGGAAPAAAAPASTPEPPQAGITTKAGNSGPPTEDFSTLFGTLHPDLANLRI